eukprot:6183568-Pleurochrysis_carterae.AAC.2
MMRDGKNHVCDKSLRQVQSYAPNLGLLKAHIRISISAHSTEIYALLPLPHVSSCTSACIYNRSASGGSRANLENARIAFGTNFVRLICCDVKQPRSVEHLLERRERSRKVDDALLEEVGLEQVVRLVRVAHLLGRPHVGALRGEREKRERTSVLESTKKGGARRLESM